MEKTIKEGASYVHVDDGSPEAIQLATERITESVIKLRRQVRSMREVKDSTVELTAERARRPPQSLVEWVRDEVRRLPAAKDHYRIIGNLTLGEARAWMRALDGEKHVGEVVEAPRSQGGHEEQGGGSDGAAR